MKAQRTQSTFIGPLYLPADVVARLERAAAAQERDALQMARWIIKQAVQAETPDRQPVEAGA